MSNFVVRCTILFLCLILINGSIFGQSRETGIIQGSVLDEEGVPLPGVTIDASSPNLMGGRSVITDGKGKYRLIGMQSGIYTIEAHLQGFSRIQKKDIQLHVGMTVDVDFILTTKKIEETVVVIGEAPLIDVTNSTLGKTIVTKDFFENIPTSNNASDIINLAPGVVSLSAYGGGNTTSNSFQIDGVEMSDAWYGGGDLTTPIDYFIIEETQITGLGAPAEYGNFTGAIVNIITKSGGNTFSGDALFTYQGQNWNSENIDSEDDYWMLIGESPKIRHIDTSFHLGGPIVKDKLWFFAGFNYVSEKIVIMDHTSPVDFPKVFGKLTFQPSQRDRFQAYFQYHNRIQKRLETSPLVMEESKTDLKYPVNSLNVSYLHTFSPSTLFEMKAAGYFMEYQRNPTTGEDNSQHYDYYTGESWGGAYAWLSSQSNRYNGVISLSHYIGDFIGGSHDIKLGFELERAYGNSNMELCGGITYQDYMGYPYQAITMSYFEGAIIWRYTFYAQDNWKITESFTVNPGIRFNAYKGILPDTGENVFNPTSWEPRIGFAWDIFNDHKTVLKAHYGRYNEGTKAYYIFRLNPARDDYVYYAVGPNWETMTEKFRIKQEGTSAYVIDPETKQPWMSQLTAGIERVVGDDITLSLSFVYRDWNDMIESVNITGEYIPISVTDPETSQTYTVYNQTNPGDDIYYITNPEKGKDIGAAFPGIVSLTPDRKYRALEISMRKRMSNNWQLYASYVYSSEKGTYPNSSAFGHGFGTGLSDVFKDPNYQINMDGRSSINVPHLFKIQGTYILPLDIFLSAYYVYHSGFTWSRTMGVTVNQGIRGILTEPAGSRRLPSASTLDVRVEKSFNIKSSRIRFMLDIFNIFNQGRVVNVSSWIGTMYFGLPTQVNMPRTYRATFRFMF